MAFSVCTSYKAKGPVVQEAEGTEGLLQAGEDEMPEASRGLTRMLVAMLWRLGVAR